ncbi:LacI family DNA-binding transcriptional regulator [Burkholderia sp. S171]|uniref:LacI family DNA-binding transcriptional regulator n=1 Tax=Burkholderia sp. S171 TaxID=1641860 RepID=UPI00131E2410|nr:LacI family DNA-binding transcriptional regulator [Burkholderia sp. S171]
MNRQKAKPNINVFDVAKAAGVSVATVSRAFNIPNRVSAVSREKVLAVAKELGYSPDPAAKALRLRKSFIIGAVIPSLDYSMFARLTHAFEEQLTMAGYSVFVVTNGFDNRNMLDAVKRIVERGAEALLLVGKMVDPKLQSYLADKQIPCVTTYSYNDDDLVPSIGFDNFAATRQAVEFLIRLGHREMAMIAGPLQGNDRQQARLSGFEKTMQAHGLGDKAHVIEKSYGSATHQGADAMRQIHHEFPDVTAVVCNADVFALSAMAECRRLGLRVPEDMSVVGFDDDDYTTIFSPALTTIAVPAAEMGRLAARSLIGALTHGGKVTPARLDTQLIVRESTSVPRVASTSTPPKAVA